MTVHAAGTETTVLVFAKAPEPGVAKTRLIPLLGAAGAASLQRVLTERALATARAADLGPVELWCTPSATHPLLARYATQFGVRALTQCDGDLGDRMLHAATSALTASSRVIIMGTDCPAMTASMLRDAASWLDRSHQAVLVPAQDGGYVLLGLGTCDAHLFAGIAWGSNQVITSTRQRLTALGWGWHELPPSWDVDRPADYERLLASGLIPDLAHWLNP